LSSEIAGAANGGIEPVGDVGGVDGESVVVGESEELQPANWAASSAPATPRQSLLCLSVNVLIALTPNQG
jgi:hypothetical protein